MLIGDDARMSRWSLSAIDVSFHPISVESGSFLFVLHEKMQWDVDSDQFQSSTSETLRRAHGSYYVGHIGGWRFGGASAGDPAHGTSGSFGRLNRRQGIDC